MREPLQSLLGKFGDTEFAQSILSDQCEPHLGTPQYVREFFTQLKRAPLLSPNTPKEYISKATFQSG
jgi:hypothetical protein